MPSDGVLDIQGIDAVLSRFKARRSGRVSAELKTTEWEVDRPSLLRPEASKSLNLRFRMIAEQLGPEIATVFRTAVATRLEKVEQLRLRAHLDSLPSRTHIFVLDVQELKLPAFITSDIASATSMIDRLVGGHGEPCDLDRDLTRIEQRVIADVILPATGVHQSVLSSIKPLHFESKHYYGTPEQLRPLPGTEIYIFMHYEIVVSGITPWKMTFALPLAELVDAIESSAAIPITTVENKKDRKDTLQRLVTDVDIGAAVEIGTAEVALADVMNLDTGDVIVLDRKTTELLDFTLEGRVKYRGRLGRSGSLMAFKVADIVESTAATADIKG